MHSQICNNQTCNCSMYMNRCHNCPCWFASMTNILYMLPPRMSNRHQYIFHCTYLYMNGCLNMLQMPHWQSMMCSHTNMILYHCSCWTNSIQMYNWYYMFGFLSSNLMKQHRKLNCCNIVSPMSMMSYTYRNIHWGSRFAYRPGYTIYNNCCSLVKMMCQNNIQTDNWMDMNIQDCQQGCIHNNLSHCCKSSRLPHHNLRVFHTKYSLHHRRHRCHLRRHVRPHVHIHTAPTT